MSEPDIKTFSGADYGVLSAMLALSLGIGFYQACAGGKQKTAEEFLMANRNMHPIPVALSLVASFISAITFLGTPAENYVHGIMHSWFWLASVFASIITMLLFMPTFYRLGITSSNEYLELRFNRFARYLGMGIFFLYMIFYLGIVLYAPSLALNAVTGLNLWGSVFAIGIVCTLYTTIGGMKAVLWTDVFQMTLMVVGFIAVIIQGALRVGGIDNAWQIASSVDDRMNIWIFSTDVTQRHTVWGILIGGTFAWTSIFGVNQAQVQRYLTCGSIEKARIAIWIAMFGMILVQVLPHIVGVVMYANYAGCDPKLHGAIASYDQLMPYFIMDLFGSMPGLPGLLTSAVFSAALSTISSGLNALAAVAGEDVIKGIWPNMKDSQYTWISKGFALLFGVVTIFSALLASEMGEILQTAMNLFGMCGGPILALFSCGMFFPWINSKGVISGTLLGLAFAFWVGIGAQIYPHPPKDPPLSADLCSLENSTFFSTSESMTTLLNYEDTTTMMMMEEMTTSDSGNSESSSFDLYKISYTWWGVFSFLVSVVSAIIISILTGPQDPRKLDPRLICPVVDRLFCCLPEKWKIPLRCGVGEDFNADEKEYEYQAMRKQDQVNHEKEGGIEFHKITET
ncbi:sodium-coupled monocarboxylate transporter 2-like [Lytechinus variegatus]|uniref:sodium-coupled monocarboxylate transporter 2-like n=1 Tax=Lytechinus variegatus TaxID=7654 RepID=UPI001BB2BDD1|nr:sodium-coupled monocarboxylate transporter 2-like [Lytechinus variegatus]